MVDQEQPHPRNETMGIFTSISRRGAVAGGAAMGMVNVLPTRADDAGEAKGLIRIAERKNAAFMSGDMGKWASLTRIAADFTLMQPFGGPTSHGFDRSPERLEQMSRYFRNGSATLEVEHTYTSPTIIVLVTIERQTAEVGGLPLQEWSLRVTEVYRREGTGWELVHRHADPLVHAITLQQAAVLARGNAGG
jgi:ketosteroid isomerase-like protein